MWSFQDVSNRSFREGLNQIGFQSIHLYLSHFSLQNYFLLKCWVWSKIFIGLFPAWGCQAWVLILRSPWQHESSGTLGTWQEQPILSNPGASNQTLFVVIISNNSLEQFTVSEIIYFLTGQISSEVFNSFHLGDIKPGNIREYFNPHYRAKL